MEKQTEEDVQVLKRCLESLDKAGKVYKKFSPILAEFEAQHLGQSGSSSSVLAGGSATSSSSADEARQLFPVTLSAPRVTVNSEHEILFSWFHLCLLRWNFIAVAEEASKVAGFAPAIRELPKGKFLLDGWNRDNSVFGSKYKHKSLPGKMFTLVAKVNQSLLEVSVYEGNTSSLSLPVDSSLYTNLASLSTSQSPAIQLAELVVRTEELKETFTGFVKRSIPFLPDTLFTSPVLIAPTVASGAEVVSENLSYGSVSQARPPTAADGPRLNLSNPSSASSTSASASASLSPPPPFSPLSDPPRYPQPRGGLPQRSGDLSVGRGDLYPSYPGAPLPFGSVPGSGSLVGPDHPIFGSGSGGLGPGGGAGGEMPLFFPGYGDGGGSGLLPVPRFDPYGPVTGPNGPDFGVGGSGGGGRGRGGAGGGRGGRGGRGEPNPDHLKPPTFDNHFT